MNLLKTVLILLLSLPAVLLCAGSTHSYNIVFIGNSITFGAKHKQPELTAPPVQASTWLMNRSEVDSVYCSNQGRSGKTTYDFLPIGGKYFPNVCKAAAELDRCHPEAPLIFSIMLGTNDTALRPTKQPTTPEEYYANMCAIIDTLLTLHPTAHVVLHRIIYYSPNTHTKLDSRMLQAGLDRMAQYDRQYSRIVKHFETQYPGQVMLGDRKAYRHFKKTHLTEMYAEQGRQGLYYLHPNPVGAERLGEYWGKALLRCIHKMQ